jgi:hypothetical protein
MACRLAHARGRVSLRSFAAPERRLAQDDTTRKKPLAKMLERDSERELENPRLMISGGEVEPA